MKKFKKKKKNFNLKFLIYGAFVFVLFDLFSFFYLFNNYIGYTWNLWIDFVLIGFFIDFLIYPYIRKYTDDDEDESMMFSVLIIFSILISSIFTLIYSDRNFYYVEKAKEDKKIDVVLYNSDRYQNEKDYLEDEKVIFYTKIILPKDIDLINTLKKKYNIKYFKGKNYVKLNEKFSKQRLKKSIIYRFYVKNKVNDLTNNLEKEMKLYLINQVNKKK